MQRYFASLVNETNIILEESDVFHLTKVMRARVGTKITAVYDKKVYLGEVSSLKPFVISNLGIYEETNRELEKDVTLFFALAKGDKIDFVIQKATELGVKRIVLIKTEHAIVKIDKDDFNKKLVRYERIAKEASEQSERTIIPTTCGVFDIKNIPNDLLSELNYVAYEKEAYTHNELNEIKKANSVSLLIGPEGGLSKEEIDILTKQGFNTISLGKRILRTETAAVVGLAMINMVIEQ